MTACHLSKLILWKRAVAGDAGVVDQDVDGADLGLDGLDAGLAGGVIADVELEDGDAGLGLEGVGGLVVAAVIGSDLVALGLEALRMAAPMPRVPPVTRATRS